MLFKYVALDKTNQQKEGTVEAVTIDSAINAVQARGYTIMSIDPIEAGGGLESLLNIKFSLFSSVSNKDIVILSTDINLVSGSCLTTAYFSSTFR